MPGGMAPPLPCASGLRKEQAGVRPRGSRRNIGGFVQALPVGWRLDPHTLSLVTAVTSLPTNEYFSRTLMRREIQRSVGTVASALMFTNLLSLCTSPTPPKRERVRNSLNHVFSSTIYSAVPCTSLYPTSWVQVGDQLKLPQSLGVLESPVIWVNEFEV